MKRLLLVGTIALLSTGGVAGAATVEVRVVQAEQPHGEYKTPEWRAILVAAAGERNDVSVSAVPDGPIRFHDPLAPLEAKDGCRSLDEHTVECALTEEQSRWDMANPDLTPYLRDAEVRAGDGDDVVRQTGNAGPVLIADGGAGDDTLTGGERTGDELDGGGGGHDRLYGLGNGDLLSDGDVSGEADADVLDGGPGDTDKVSYAGRTGDLRIDLADAAGDGERGEDDRLRGLEYATGGAGDDDIGGDEGMSVLEGGPGDDHLDGEQGTDMLYGGGGDDRVHGHTDADDLFGGPGRDELRGGKGYDSVYEPSSLDRISCGAQEDALISPGSVFVPRNCERFLAAFEDWPVRGEEPPSLELDPHATRSSSGRSLRIDLDCVVDGDGDCRAAEGTLSLSSASGAPLGRARVTSGYDDGNDRPPVVVPLNALGRRVVARRGVVRVSLGGDALPDLRWRVRAR